MTLRNRPIHCKFETLRLTGDLGRVNAPYHRGGLSAIEQLTARNAPAISRMNRPLANFPDRGL